jgi:hypothetical protein
VAERALLGPPALGCLITVPVSNEEEASYHGGGGDGVRLHSPWARNG